VPAEVLPYAVRRSVRARRARLTVTADGRVVVVLPQRAPLRAAELLVHEHADWVRRHVLRAQAQQAHLDARPALAAGRVLSVNGIPHEVVVREIAGPPRESGLGATAARARRGSVRRRLLSDAEGIRGELLITPGTHGTPGPHGTPGGGVADLEMLITALLEGWLRAEARRVLTSRVAALSPQLGVTAGRLSVRAQRSRWGSASRDGALSLNWRLILAPAFVLDAVVVHELAHLRVRGHSTAFWTLAKTHAPRTDEARRWLRAHHRELLAALD
jgi:predicted metal-dependent hydrolase